MASTKNIKKTAWYKDLDKVDKNFLEKLTLDPRAFGDRDVTLRSAGSSVQKIFNKQIQNISDIKNIFKVLPQLNFPRKILTSSVLSPGDITKTGIVVDNSLKLSDYTLSSQMSGAVRELMENELELPSKLARWIDQALILEGSYPILTLPSSVVDSIMNVNMESSMHDNWYNAIDDSKYLAPIGLLGVKVKDTGNTMSFESANTPRYRANIEPWQIDGEVSVSKNKVKIELPITLTDNPRVLAKSIINEYKISQSSVNAYGDTSFESMVRYPDKDGKKPEFMPSDIRKQLFKTANTSMDRILILPTPLEIADDVNVGHPIQYDLPSDCVIPVSSPGDPEDHKYYIVLLDDNGYPISGINRLQHMSEIQAAVKRSNDSSDVTSTLLSSARDSLGMSGDSYDLQVIDEMARINSALIESEVSRSIMAGANGGQGKIELSDNVSKLMLSRTLRGRRTVMLYIPADYITYIAFNYNELGVGKSILEDSKSMAGMLSTLTVANVIGSVEAAIPGKVLRLKLDPSDRDPLNSATFLAREAMDLSFRRFPMGLNSTIGVAEELQMNSYSVVVEGHPAFPEVEATMESKQTTSVPIDTELMDKLNEYMHLIFSIPPELAGSANQADFATTVVTNNLMLLKTVIEIQTVANKHLSRYGRNFVRFSGVMVAKFFAIIESNKGALPVEYKGKPAEFIGDFIESIKISLPSPETDNLTHQMELLNNYSTALETAWEAYLNSESILLDGYTPEIVEKSMPTLKAAYKNHMLRQYMRSRAILPEMDIFRMGDEDNPTINLSDESKTHSKLVVKSIRKFIESMSSVIDGEDVELKRVAKKDIKARDKAEKVDEAFNNRDDGDNTHEESGSDPVDDTGSDDTVVDVDDGGADQGTDENMEDPIEESEEANPEDSGQDESEEDDKEANPDDLPSDSIDEDKL